MDEIKNFFIAFILIFLILVIWQYLFLPKPQTKTEQPKKIGKEKTVSQEILTPTPQEIPKIEEKEIILENKAIRLTFSNIGAVLKAVYLKRYECALLKNRHQYFGIILFSPQETINLNNQIFNYQIKEKEVIFEYQWEDKKIVKSYKIADDYLFLFNLSLPDKKYQSALTFDKFLNFTEKDSQEDLNYSRYQYYFKKQVKGIDLKKMKNNQTVYEKEIDWLTMKTKYFLFSLIPHFSLDSCQFLREKGGAIIYPQQSKELSATFIFAPLEYNLLKSFKIGLEKAIPLGWPRSFSLAILFILKFLYRILGNYGWAIVVFALFLKLLFFPFSRLQNEQMRKMQLLQPKLEELKKKYKDDPQTLNRETMQLYQLYKINPFMGCLPLIIQLPVFWALYSVFRQTIDLRKASFIFWLKDLSAKDPIYVLPIIMGACFLFQNILTNPDKKNVFLVFLFPIFLTLIFLNFPSGLQLYWLIFNVLSILESLIFQKGGFKWLKIKTKAKP
jgi:YidC/Oxa1 family membrane protein insertase